MTTKKGHFEKQKKYVSSGNKYGIVLCEDLKEIILGTASGKLEFYDFKKKTKKREIKLQNNFIWPMARVSKDTLICTEYEIHIINIVQKKVIGQMSGHTNTTYGCSHLRGPFLATSSHDRKIIIWDWTKKKQLWTKTSTNMSIQTCYTRKYFCTVGYNRKVEVFTPNSNFTQMTKKGDCHIGRDTWSICKVDKTKIAVGNSTSVELWDVEHLSRIAKWNQPSNWVYQIVYANDRLLCASYDRFMYIFDVKKKLFERKLNCGNALSAIAVSSRGEIYCAGYCSDLMWFKSPYKGKDTYSNDDDEWYDDAPFQSGEFEKRLEFLTNSDKCNLTLQFTKKDLDFYKFMMISSNIEGIEEEDEDDYRFPKEIQVDADDLGKILFGMKVNIPDEQLFDYYDLFYSYGWYGRAYLICKRIEAVKNLGVLLFLYKKCFKKYEKTKVNIEEKIKKDNKIVDKETSIMNAYLELGADEDDKKDGDDESDGEEDEEDEDTQIKREKRASQFKSPFCLAIFNEFKEREDDIHSKKKLFKAMEKEKLIEKLKKYDDDAPIKKHPVFAGKTLPRTFLHAYRMDLERLYHTKKFANITLRSCEGTPIEAHQEVLILGGNFFQKMVHFGGIESSAFLKMGEITLEYLSTDMVNELLNFVYLGKIESDDIQVLFKLLIHATMYFEKDLKSVLLRKLKKVIKAEVAKSDIYYFLRRYSEYLKNDIVVQDLIDFFSLVGNIEQSQVIELIDNSKQDEKIQWLRKRMFFLENANGMLQKKVNEMEEKIVAVKKKFGLIK